jgi:hypothetical protein
MITCERHRDLIDRAALLSEAVVRTYVQNAAAGTPRYGKALLKYGAAVGKLVQHATLLGGEAWNRAAEACRITHLGLAALYLQAGTADERCDIRLIQEAARLSHHLREIADTFGRLPFRPRTEFRRCDTSRDERTPADDTTSATRHDTSPTTRRDAEVPRPL